MKKTTLVIVFDAGRYDYINKNDSPFLYSLKERFNTSEILTSKGFCQRSVMFTGKNPDENGNLGQYMYSPETSPFKWVKPFNLLSNFIYPTKVTYPVRILISKITGWKSDSVYTDPVWIPLNLLHYFDLSEDRKPIHHPDTLIKPNLFSMLSNRKIRYLMHPVSGDDSFVKNKILSSEDDDLILAQFSDLDPVGHIYGPDSDKRKKSLKKLDMMVQEIFKNFESKYDFDFMLFGDHGMMNVDGYVNLLKPLKKTGLKVGEDFAYFLSSTVANFWFFNENAEKEIRDILSDEKHGMILTEKEERKYGIHFKNRKFGDLLFWIEPGQMIWPDFFHIRDRKILGMHGYLEHRDMNGFMISNLKLKRKTKLRETFMMIRKSIGGK